jgi:poly(hydroxyalkanoate) depolymerase family esterase
VGRSLPIAASCCTAAFELNAMSLHSISNTIHQALSAAGLDPQHGALQRVTQTIRKALADAGIAQRDAAPPRAGRPAFDDEIVDVVAREVPAPAQAAPEAPGASHGRFVTRTYVGPGGSRAYKLYVPAAGAGRQPMPLIVMLHGCKQNPDDFAAGTGMNLLAEQHGFLVAYPEQTARANGANCWNWFNAADQARDGAEPAIIAGIAREIAAAEAVDKQRVFVAGLSAGAAMAVILGTTHADVFAAVGAHSGLPHGAAHDVASAFAAMHGRAKPVDTPLRVPAIVFHGDQDRTVVASNGDAIVAQAIAGQREKLHKKTTNGRDAGGKREHVRTVWADDAGRPRVEQWALHGGAHAWSGGSPAGSYTDALGPDASAEMVRFFLAQ